MRPRFLPIFFLLFFLSGIIFSCSDTGKLYRSKNIEDREKAAKILFEKKDYEKAVFVFEELLSIYKGTGKAEEVLYYYAWCKYHLKDYLTAAFYFNDFANQFPNSQKAEYSQYMYGYCFYRDSDPWYLDQSSTRKAVENLQFYLKANPGSNRVDSCNLLMSEMREKLAQKSFEQANLYLKIGYHKAAIESFRHMLEEFPDSRQKEEAIYKQFLASVLYAQESVSEKQMKRYLEAISYYRKFVDKYPSSPFIRDAEAYYIKVNKAIARLEASAGILKSE
jgi:outer membrane protein assembly factor BamD